MKHLLFSTLIALVSCNRGLPIPHQVSIDSQFQPYVNAFVQEGHKQGRDITIDNLIITFNHIDQHLGECNMYDHGTTGIPTIYINEVQWNYYSETSRKVMIFHEMGHCVLWREHSASFYSIMYPYLLGDSMYIYYWNDYMKELFD